MPDAAGAPATDDHADLRWAVRELCERFPDSYWRELGRTHAYPEAFVAAVTDAGYLGMLIPEAYGGLGMTLDEACVVLEEIHAAGGNAAAIHAQMYTMGTVLRHGSEAQKQRWLPGIAAGTIRLQSFAITEPDAGTDTTRITTTAVRDGEGWRISGKKVWTSRLQHSDLMLLLARTTPYDEVERKTQGITTFLVDTRDEAVARAMRVVPIETMVGHETNEVFLTDLWVPDEARIGEAGAGFRSVLDSMNAERILIAAECIGDARWFVDRSRRYATDRVVFGRPIGRNQGIQFPIARAHVQASAADLMRRRAAALFDAGQPCGPEANMAKLLASEASWFAADTAIQVHGGYGFAVEYDIERKFRETRLYQVAPISTNLILSYVGEHVLGMPRSY